MIEILNAKEGKNTILSQIFPQNDNLEIISNESNEVS